MHLINPCPFTRHPLAITPLFCARCVRMTALRRFLSLIVAQTVPRAVLFLIIWSSPPLSKTSKGDASKVSFVKILVRSYILCSETPAAAGSIRKEVAVRNLNRRSLTYVRQDLR